MPRIDWAGKIQETDIDLSSSGDQTVVSASTDKTIRVYKIFYVCNAANNIILKSGSNTLVPIITHAAGGSFSFADESEGGHLPITCNSGEAFIMNLSASQQVSGRIWYIQE